MAADGSGIVRSAEWRRVRGFAASGPGRSGPALLAVVGEAGAGKSTPLDMWQVQNMLPATVTAAQGRPGPHGW